MGNCIALCKPHSGSGIAGDLEKQGKVVRVAKLDGKILEFSKSILVKDILTNFPDSGIGSSREASESELLSPDYELKPGRLYCLVPSLHCPPKVSSFGNKDTSSRAKRVKIVITKRKLEKLVAKQISLEGLLAEAQTRTLDLPSNWRPKLDPIPEGVE